MMGTDWKWAAASVCQAYVAFRIVTERSAVAMPEVGIGFFPDVGALFPLARSPGMTGTHLALTGDRMNAADAILLRLCRCTDRGCRFPNFPARCSIAAPRRTSNARLPA